jgi:hypothetical protein
VQFPAAKRPALQGAVQRQHPQVEHVALGVGLGPRVEQQPAGVPRPELLGRRRLDGGDRVLERRRVPVATVGVDADLPAPEEVTQQFGGEQRGVVEAV